MPFLRKVWAAKGSRPKGTFWWSNKKANLFGALIDGKELYYEWYDKLNAHYFIDFMKCFIDTLDKNKKYVFVFDNAPAHRAKISQKYLESLGKHIFIEFMPPYSPQLNCIETCWKIIRYNVTNSNWFKTIEELKNGIEIFLDGHFFTLKPNNYLTR
ncbi:MAG: transposase [Vicingaceae bacterium]|nr:transposase [Vicingaceae bacterium]